MSVIVVEVVKKQQFNETQNSKRISVILKKFIDNISTPYITIGEIKDILSDRAFGTLMLLFALPNPVPLPIPLWNWFPAFTICLFALSIIERDGILLVLLGLIFASISITLISTVIFTVLKSVLFFIEKLFV